jgi:hypothetical protein
MPLLAHPRPRAVLAKDGLDLSERPLCDTSFVVLSPRGLAYRSSQGWDETWSCQRT